MQSLSHLVATGRLVVLRTAYADSAHLLLHQSVYSGSAHGKAHPNYVHLSASDCTTAGERQACCASPQEVFVPKLHTVAMGRGLSFCPIKTYADYAHLLDQE